MIISEYDSQKSGDIGRLPIRVKSVHYVPGGKVDREMTVELAPGPNSLELDVKFDPGDWTLAGLGMPIGEPVTNHLEANKEAYWNGKTLVDTRLPEPPIDKALSPRPSVARLMEVARRDPADTLAVDAIDEIATFDKNAPEIREGLALLAKHHAASPGVGAVALSAFEMHPEDTETLCRGILEKNPSREDQGLACYSLAEILKTRSERSGQFGIDRPEDLFERVITSFGDIKNRYREKLGEHALKALADMKAAGVGRPAPELEGLDMDGKATKLSDFRGKVVVVSFWASWCGPCLRMVPKEREMVAKMSGRPFVLLGANLDKDKAQARTARGQHLMTWPSLALDSDEKHIDALWAVNGLPTTYVIDPRGVIRFRNLHDEALEKAVDALMAVSAEATP
ncbi:TlpA family protein disulfide reductase [Singulisphaera sp. PoT]|uniref:TlpA family protein disulfide reductase n=1 Tax=Singulisphaera sp. PoT TaxID=3411797 RepID=UPI003BF61835